MIITQLFLKALAAAPPAVGGITYIGNLTSGAYRFNTGNLVVNLGRTVAAGTTILASVTSFSPVITTNNETWTQIIASSSQHPGIWACTLNNATSNITINTPANNALYFNIINLQLPAGKQLLYQQTATINDGDDAMTLSGLPSREYLFVRGVASAKTDVTPTTGYTSGGFTYETFNLRGSFTEFKILQATGSTSQPTFTGATYTDTGASRFTALYLS